MRWKWTELGSTAARSISPRGNAGLERIRADLEQRGVAPELCERLSLRVEERALKLESDAYESLLDGVAAASGVHDQSEREMAEHLRDLHEVERLMGGFSKELAKLDEVLEVLAAHVRRMRSNVPSAADRRLH